MGACCGEAQEPSKFGGGKLRKAPEANPASKKQDKTSLRLQSLNLLKKGEGCVETFSLSIQKSRFKEFISNELSALLQAINQASNKTFLPTGLSASPSAPNEELMLLLRNANLINSKFGPYQLAGNKIPEPTMLPQVCQSFALHTINFTKNGLDIERIKGTVIN